MSKYVAINSQGIEVPAIPVAQMSLVSRRVGFCHVPYYMVGLNWIAINGEVLRTAIPSYCGTDRSLALAKKHSLERDYCK